MYTLQCLTDKVNSMIINNNSPVHVWHSCGTSFVYVYICPCMLHTCMHGLSYSVGSSSCMHTAKVYMYMHNHIYELYIAYIYLCRTVTEALTCIMVFIYTHYIALHSVTLIMQGCRRRGGWDGLSLPTFSLGYMS